jgi:carboxyl-terminal processing protease
VIRIGALLMVLSVASAHGQPASDQPQAGGLGFDTQLVRDVYGEALAFMVPRILEPVPVPQLSIWGLRGLTALDPALIASLRDGRLRLSSRSAVVFDIAAPKDDTPVAWAAAVVNLSAAGVSLSPLVRRAGTQGVIQAFFDELFNHLDPYSRYVAPSEAGADREHRTGQAGLGLSLARRGALQIAVRAVINDSPAALAGLRPGDLILAVDGQPAAGQDPATVAALIAGPEGTWLSLQWRGRDGRTRTARIERAMVPPETVFSERMGGMLVIRVTGFTSTTDVRLAHSLQQGMAGPHPPAGIVIDLRGNRGGLMRQAVTAADAFLPAGVVATTAGRAPDAGHAWLSSQGEFAVGVPLVLVVDGRTASAAEILAAALADRGRAVVVGSTTLGKGLVQTIDPLPDGGELFVTWSRVLAPLGWPIQGLGVLPQVCTSLGRDTLQRQLLALAAGVQPMAGAIRLHRASRAPMSAAQLLAVRNICPAAEGRDLDLEAARTLIKNPAAYGAALLSFMQATPP